MSTPEKRVDPYRWYLCEESKKRSHWDCELVPQTEVEKYGPESRTIVVPIRQWVPSSADFMIINNALKQTFSVKK
jgi:hypothetical protein